MTPREQVTARDLISPLSPQLVPTICNATIRLNNALGCIVSCLKMVVDGILPDVA